MLEVLYISELGSNTLEAVCERSMKLVERAFVGMDKTVHHIQSAYFIFSELTLICFIDEVVIHFLPCIHCHGCDLNFHVLFSPRIVQMLLPL